ncbi:MULTISPECIES: DUF4177 domain-containing protein [Shouchella]|uniref:DUF4177 domain-containing protein n=1 Tax=Shouchella clausii TaxID=79880 RepID=A0A268P3Z5_SHOCL|nr:MULTISPECIES: DUF4177 domain-containing protein [Shouchella]MBU3231081.1 DUF4177 domain-containing protein [Shouchella clausii]MBU3262844.1 DUF4177 domain-containing protein [Shouchella clausii]MBU3505308.1 DUF4177 domain-containing protein [Shouchella clausii]MBU3534647.1 DUF4177 domain-containing protein [Shouchella clausii]MBX0310092.1 DUF4177 domain-containing protein [Shouchella clausii]
MIGIEYKTILLPVANNNKNAARIGDTLNELAKEGWELISLVAQQSYGGTDGNLAVFKRNP